MNVSNLSNRIQTGFALWFLALNFLNLVAWSFGSYLHPVLFLVSFMAFIPLSFLDLQRNWMILATFICFILIILGAPLFDWDARYIWFFHGKRIFFDNNLYAQLDNYFWEIHNDYPVLVPAIAASFAKGVGFWNEVFPRLSVIPVLFPVFMVLRLLIKRNGIFGLSVVGILFVGKQYLVNGYMDALLGLYGAAACLLVVKLNSEEWKWETYLMLWGILLTLPMIKNEGLLASLLIWLSMIPVFWNRKAALVLPVLAFALYYLLWKQPVSSAGIETTDLFVPGILNRAMNRLGRWDELSELSNSVLKVSGVYYLGLLIFILRFRKQLRSWITPIFFVLSYSAAMLVVYLITALDLKFHLDHSVDRTFLIVNLGIFLMLVKFYDNRAEIEMKA